MKRRIVVPLDGSARSESILDHARALAHSTHGEIILLSTIPAPGGAALARPSPLSDSFPAGHGRDRCRPALAQLERNAAALRGEGLPVGVDMVEDRNPAAGVITYVERDPAVTLICMATGARGPLGRWLFGSVAARVLRAAPVPVLLTRAAEARGRFGPRPTLSPYPCVLVPLDGSALAEQALWHAAALLAAPHVTFLLVSVTPSPRTLLWAGSAGSAAQFAAGRREEEERIATHLVEVAARLRREGVSVQMHVTHGSPAEEILRVAAGARVDLIAMGTRGESRARLLARGSIAARLVRESGLPVLAVGPAVAADRLPGHQPGVLTKS